MMDIVFINDMIYDDIECIFYTSSSDYSINKILLNDISPIE